MKHLIEMIKTRKFVSKIVENLSEVQENKRIEREIEELVGLSCNRQEVEKFDRNP